MILNLLRNRINRCTVEAIIKTNSNRYKNKILTVQSTLIYSISLGILFMLISSALGRGNIYPNISEESKILFINLWG